MNFWQSLLMRVLRIFSRLNIQGASHLTSTETGLLVIANHCNLKGQLSLLSSITKQEDKQWLLCIHSQAPFWKYPLVAKLLFPWILIVVVDPVDQKNGQSVSATALLLENHLRKKGKAVIFPAGGAAKPGHTHKYYGWSLLAAQQADADVIAIHVEQSPACDGVKKLAMTILPPRRVNLKAGQVHATNQQGNGNRNRRQAAGQLGQDLLGEAALAHSLGHYTVWQMLCRTVCQHGRHRLAITDSTGKKATYGQLLTRSLILGKLLAEQTQVGAYVGILLPTSTTAITTFFALQAFGRVPAMLNFTAGPGPVSSACQTARIKTIYSSRLFVRKAGLEPLVTALQNHANIVFLEDLLTLLKPWRLLWGWLLALFPEKAYRHFNPGIKPGQPAVVLFTSGSEGEPKGVVLSHDNLLANSVQIHARIDVNPDDIMLNVLPMFHAFGLTVGSLLPLFAGIRCHCLPSPLEYHLIPELAYALRASLLAGTDTFLAGYARTADACDFLQMRYVFAGAEPLLDKTRHLWMERFGIRILEGYGTTEASPVLAVNTPMACRSGTVGRLLPGINFRLDPVPGISVGALLSVQGPNIMLGYLLANNNGSYYLPESQHGDGWYASGDIVSMDEQGFLRIIGRAKRFAKIGGEMISLTVVENLATTAWPDYRHAVVSHSDPRKGEQLVLVTEHPNPNRQELFAQARIIGLKGLFLPKKILSVAVLPLLGSGKCDLSTVTTTVESWLKTDVQHEINTHSPTNHPVLTVENSQEFL